MMDLKYLCILKDFPVLQIARDDAIYLIDKYKKGIGYQELIQKIEKNLSVNNEYID